MIHLTLLGLRDENPSSASESVGNKMRVLYTNADQFLNKRDLLLAQLANDHPPDIIIITEMLPKSPNAVIKKI